jgi:hypothetical protein
MSVALAIVPDMTKQNASELTENPWLERFCPFCHQKGGLRKVIWGLPESEPNEDLFEIGGCCPEDYRYVCISCDWKGKRLPK